jgi:hypothetical protein
MQGQALVSDATTNSRYQFSFPWAGGMNSCQFGKLDIDRDGIRDLVVFDRCGDRIMPFLIKPSGESFDYYYAPEYASCFPELKHWAIFADYDRDGREDIFTYSPGFAGLKVYKNVSAENLEFKLEVFPFLTSFQGGGYVNVLVTYADYPAIVDLDGDGDLDMLTFYGLGSFVEKHQNMSMEKYGHADSLDFIRTEYCWGYFAESEESNDISLDTCLRCGDGKEEKRGQGEEGSGLRHTGSTFSVRDLNGDGLLDLLLGDVDYPNLLALYNGGSVDTARMISYDWEFPESDREVHLFSMPAAFHEDIDFDGIKDMLVSPFDPNHYVTKNFSSVWFYHNQGSDANPDYAFYSSSFLQNRMLDLGAGAYPVLYDIDDDGLTDVIAGNYGYYDTSYLDEHLILHTEHIGKLAFLRNTGSLSTPSFDFRNNDFALVSGLEKTGISPAFADLDGDGDGDMLLGCDNGQLIFYRNIAEDPTSPLFELEEENYFGIDVGTFSSPCFFDLDKDGLTDLIIGEKGGNLNYYRNAGTAGKPSFILISDSLGKINVTDPNVSLDGFSTPYFYRDLQGNTHLLVGSEQGYVFYYTGVDNNLNGAFTLSDTLAGLLGLSEVDQDAGFRSAPALADLDSDGFPELICGNFSGGLQYFSKNNSTPISSITDIDRPQMISVYPVPASDRIFIDYRGNEMIGNVVISIYNPTGSLVCFEEKTFNDHLQISVKDFNPGLYFLKISILNKNGKTFLNESFRIIIQ